MSCGRARGPAPQFPSPAQEVRADSEEGKVLLETCPGLFSADEATGLLRAGNARGHEMVLERVRRERSRGPGLINWAGLGVCRAHTRAQAHRACGNSIRLERGWWRCQSCVCCVHTRPLSTTLTRPLNHPTTTHPTQLRRLLEQERFSSCVAYRKRKDHFIFTIESSGVLHPAELLAQALDILADKANNLRDKL